MAIQNEFPLYAKTKVRVISPTLENAGELSSITGVPDLLILVSTAGWNEAEAGMKLRSLPNG